MLTRSSPRCSGCRSRIWQRNIRLHSFDGCSIRIRRSASELTRPALLREKDTMRPELQRSSVIALILLSTMTGSAPYRKKTVVAHRGASAYAPEHTAAAYQLAIQMGADFVEQDLAVTKDNVLICIHDPTLERTTNVEDVFPDRSSMQAIGGRQRKVWLANDFTLAEIKQLDAGSWMDKKFASEKILTFDEAWEIIHGKAGMFPEIKDPEIYNARHVEFEQLVA